ncbi:MAG: hypothetical protein GY810_18420 [Aureispira sp.]|nr:hypothetical protein [Aureispira sp.]
MTQKQLKLLEQLEIGAIDLDTLDKQFGVELWGNLSFIEAEIDQAIEKGDREELNTIIPLIYFIVPAKKRLGLLHKLLLYPYHNHHQSITKDIQDLANAESVPYIQKALEMGFGHLDYTCSEDGTIAKWFSWALYTIGTGEAINLLQKFSESDNEEIREEMLYRLSKIED